MVKWNDKKEEKIENVFKQLCAVNLIISRDTIDYNDFFRI